MNTCYRYPYGIHTAPNRLLPRTAIAMLSIALWAGPGHAQNANPCFGPQAGKVACLLTDVVLGAVQNVNPAFQLDPRIPLGTSVISTQLTSALPMPAPAAGYLYQYDPNLGTARAERQSYGPIFGERAETIGLHKFSLGFTNNLFRFDRVDGIDLKDQPNQLVLGDNAVSNHFQHDLRIGQRILTGIYGLRERVDISVAVPFSSVTYQLGYRGSYQSFSTNQHLFDAAGKGRRTAQGLGDIQAQVKATVFRGERASLASGVGFRLPTGDAYNVLGSGAAGVRPFVAASFLFGRLAPHVNAGYLFNGKSVLAADSILSGEKRRIPSQFQYAVGADAGITDRITVAFDVVGFEAIHADRLGSYPAVTLIRESFNVTNGAAGVKVRLLGNLLLQANVLFRLNQGGLHHKAVPLIGLSHTF